DGAIVGVNGTRCRSFRKVLRPGTSPGLDQYHPEGMVENSPAFQRRESSPRGPRPEETAERDGINRFFGFTSWSTLQPTLKRRISVDCLVPLGLGGRTAT